MAHADVQAAALTACRDAVTHFSHLSQHVRSGVLTNEAALGEWRAFVDGLPKTATSVEGGSASMQLHDVLSNLERMLGEEQFSGEDPAPPTMRAWSRAGGGDPDATAEVHADAAAKKLEPALPDRLPTFGPRSHRLGELRKLRVSPVGPGGAKVPTYGDLESDSDRASAEDGDLDAMHTRASPSPFGFPEFASHPVSPPPGVVRSRRDTLMTMSFEGDSAFSGLEQCRALDSSLDRAIRAPRMADLDGALDPTECTGWRIE